MALFRKKTPKWAIDLGNRWAKGVQLKKSHREFYLHRLGRFLWYRSDLDAKEKKAGRIRDFGRILEFEGNEIVTSVTGHSVIVKIINFSSEKEKEIGDLIKQRIEEYIPFDIKDIYFTYETVKLSDDTTSVFLVASKRKVIDDLKEICDLANLKISIIDVDSFALINCFEFNYPELVDKNIYILDIGSQHSIFCVYSDRSPIFIRDLNFGGDEIVDRVSTIIGTSFLEAEKNVLSNFKEVETKQKIKLFAQLEDQISFWADEVLRTINFFKTSYKKEFSADHMLLTGGGSLFPKVVDIFSKKINTEISLFNPWKKIKYNENNIDKEYLKFVGPQFVVATGLALRSWS